MKFIDIFGDLAYFAGLPMKDETRNERFAILIFHSIKDRIILKENRVFFGEEHSSNMDFSSPQKVKDFLLTDYAFPEYLVLSNILGKFYIKGTDNYSEYENWLVSGTKEGLKLLGIEGFNRIKENQKYYSRQRIIRQKYSKVIQYIPEKQTI